MLTRIIGTIALGALPFAAGCNEASTSPRDPGDVSGEYVLVTVAGRGPTSAAIALYANGFADRRAQYAAAGPTGQAFQIGTYTLDSDGIAFSLRDAIAASSIPTWVVRGEWQDDGFFIRYLDPADGPDIVETYRRR